ncbi:MAG: DUF3524 domain-containing protein [Phycisphaerae bacterium]
MQVLALEPYYGGSHRAFLDGWMGHSRHDWTLLTLPAHHWKWRMRHAAVDWARQFHARCDAGERWDAVVCSDMLDLAAFRGLAPGQFRNLPAVAYFHESQLTYPTRRTDPRDVHFALTNYTTAMAAERVWFNSAFHRDAFCDALGDLLRKMPDRSDPDAAEAIRKSAEVRPPGIGEDLFEPSAADAPTDPGNRDSLPAGRPMHILWAARWEHDKGPAEFFHAIDRLDERGVDFRLSVVGEQFREVPPEFATARRRHGRRIVRWGYQPTREAYVKALREAEVFVSTARHEFFGIAAVEAAACGALPVLPDRLAYPEVFGGAPGRAAQDACSQGGAACFYGESADDLADALTELAGSGGIGMRESRAAREDWARRFSWSRLARGMDESLERL